MSAFKQNDPIYIFRRDGSTSNPYLNISEPLTVNDGRVLLTEIPEKFSRVTAKDSLNVALFETASSNVKENEFYVDYNQGIVYFHSSKNGATITLSYKGTGVFALSDSRIYTEMDSNRKVTETLKDLTTETKLARDTANQTNDTVTSNENVRVQNEDQRILDESTRQSNESTRQTKETERQNAETTRITDENTRKSNETTRVSAENTRITNEESRKTSESSRQSEELTRSSNETNRVQQETFRSNAEEQRVLAEDIREQQEDDRQTNTNAAIGRVDSVVAETRYKEVYSPTTAYKKNNVVYNNGSAYMAKQDTTGNVPTDDPTNPYWALISRKGADGNGTIHVYKDTFVATEGQTIFTLKNTYDQFSNRTNITVGGVPQRTPENYEEASSNTIVLNSGVPAGTIVEVKYYSEALPLQTDLQTTVDNHTVEINKFNDQSIYIEDFVATEGQSVFTLQTTYDQLQDKVEVYVEGLLQDSGDNYAESANNQITLSEGVPAGTEVKVRYYGRRLPVVSDVEATLNTHSTTLSNHTTELNNHSSELSSVTAQLADIAYNVKTFGAVGDGITDDFTVVQNVINSMTGGGTLFFPEGDYKFSQNLSITVNGIKFKGAGMDKTILSHLSSVIDKDLINAQGKNMHFSDFTIKDVKSSNPPTTESHGLDIYLSENVVVERVKAINCDDANVRIQASNHVVIKDCVTLDSPYGSGIEVINSVENGYCDFVVIENCFSKGNSQHGIRLTGVNNGVCANNKILSNNLNGISVQKGKDIKISSNILLSNYLGLDIYGLATDVTIVGNTISDSSLSGVRVSTANTGEKVSSIVVSSNTIKNNDRVIAGYGQIQVERPNADDIILSGNTILNDHGDYKTPNKGRYGIKITGDNSNGLMTSNIVRIKTDNYYYPFFVKANAGIDFIDSNNKTVQIAVV